MNKFYYDVHVFISRKSGYSIPVMIETNDDMLLDDEVIQYCIDNKRFTEEGDENQVDTVDEISEYEYQLMKS